MGNRQRSQRKAAGAGNGTASKPPETDTEGQGGANEDQEGQGGAENAQESQDGAGDDQESGDQNKPSRIVVATELYRFAVDGIKIVTFQKGDELSGKVAEQALEDGKAEVVE